MNQQKNQQKNQTKQNYQKILDRTIEELQQLQRVPTLLLHSCCAPCSSYVLEYLSEYFQITVLYYNPNIYPDEEYKKRVAEQKKFIERFPAKNRISFIEGRFNKEDFYAMAKGLEEVPEGGERCFACYEMRLHEAAEYAKRLGMDYFTTTLTISPLKNASWLNELGQKAGELLGVEFLPSDFKKKGGYQRSIQLSKEYNLYRQNFCGCIFSKRESEERMNKQKNIEKM